MLVAAVDLVQEAPNEKNQVEPMLGKIGALSDYALRKQTPEPVFGVIKSGLGFRHLSIRKVDKVRGEWSLANTARNLKRMFVLAAV